MESKWMTDVQRHATNVDERAVAGIVRYRGIALQGKDSSLVSFSDKSELARVRDNFLKKRLGLTNSDAELEAAIAAVGEFLKANMAKNRVTVYYLLAERVGKLSTFV
jgi:hypothetical protein